MTKAIKFTAVVLSMFLAQSYSVFACAPEFDNAYFIRDTKEHFLAIPEGNFLFELQRISGKKDVFKLVENPNKQVVDRDIEDLKSSLKLNKEKDNLIEDVVVSYQKARQAITAYLDVCTVEDQSKWYGGRFRSHERDENIGKYKPAPEISLSSKVPVEFSRYLKGAAKYHANDFIGAISEWGKVLALPKAERHFKSTWASFMIGKAYLSMHKQHKALPYFEMTRKLAKERFADSLSLSDESVGWQALAEYELKDYVASIKHYLDRMDVNSLNRICLKVSETTDNTIQKAVKDKTSRDVLLGWAVSRPYWNSMEWGEDASYSDFFDRLLSAIEGLKEKDALEYADRVAWLYYNRGNFEKAKRWVLLSKLKTPLAQFVDFKITLREGNVEEAMRKLSNLVPAFVKSSDKELLYGENVERMLNSEMAVLQLSRKEYLKAFELLLRGKYWEDIAYVAEKVLTAEELEKFLEQNKTSPELATKQKWYQGYYAYLKEQVKMHPEDKEFYADSLKEDGPTLFDALSYLLARRYAREGNWDKAIKFMPHKETISRSETKMNEKEGYLEYEQVLEEIDPKAKAVELKKLLETGQNEKLYKKDRSKAYFDAGIIMRKYGMELMGTELDPDGFVDRGAYSYYGGIQSRFAIFSDQAKADYSQWNKDWIEKNKILREEIKNDRGFFYGSQDEEKRALESLPSPNRRFHYRYKAADLMWKAANLLSDNDPLKARALWQGGAYLLEQDNKAADKFYKELVKTCKNTALGKEAERIHWFPKREWYEKLKKDEH